jgi:hypothetical protein
MQPSPTKNNTHLALNQNKNQKALTPLVEGIIGRDMERFREYAAEYARAAAAAAAPAPPAGGGGSGSAAA